MKNLVKIAVVIGALSVAGLTAQAQLVRPPVYWTFSNSGMATNVVAGAGAATTGVTNTAVSPTNLFLGALTNVYVEAAFNVWSNSANAMTASTSDYIGFQGSMDYGYWNSLGQVSNATWVADPALTLVVPLNNTGIITALGGNLNSQNVATNGYLGATNFNVSKYTAIRQSSWSTGGSNSVSTNLSLIFFWK